MKVITIVSGLPRSGTSVMMQMLTAGGMEPLTDKERTPDDNNPKGYLEDERTKSLHKDNSWVGEAQGKVLKVVANLLQYLPDKYDYKVVFMIRDIEEVIMSQQKMLGKDPEKIDATVAAIFKDQVEKALELCERKNNMKVIEIKHREVITHPEETANTVADFVDEDLDTDAMANIVDPSLHRNVKK